MPKHLQSHQSPAQLDQSRSWNQSSCLKLKPPEPARGTIVLKGPGGGARRSRALKPLLLIVGLWALSVLGYYFAIPLIRPTLQIHNHGMSPTLQEGDRYTWNRWAFCKHPPRRGDLVVLKSPGHG